MVAEQSPQAFWLEELGQADAFTQWVFSEMAPHLKGDVLEIGCGTGTFTRLIAGKAEHVTAMDIDRAFLDEAARRLRDFPNVQVAQGDVTRDELPGQFDTIVMLDVLEHLPDDRDVLLRLRRALKAGGRIVLKVPAHAWLYSPLDSAIGHHRRYTRRSLKRVMEEAGLTELRVWPFNRAAMLGWWLNGRVLKRVTPPSAQIRGFDRMVPLLRRLERWAPLPLGLSYFAVGRAAGSAAPAAADTGAAAAAR